MFKSNNPNLTKPLYRSAIGRRWPQILVWAVGFAGVGVALLVATNAATPYDPASSQTPSSSAETAAAAVSAAVPAAMWLPTAEAPLDLHGMLGGALDVNNRRQMGKIDLSGNPIAAPKVYELDGEYTTKEAIDILHAEGKKAICTVSAGAYDSFRKDAKAFKQLKPQIWGSTISGWPGSYWLDIRRVTELQPILMARFQDCKDKGFDAIEPDWLNGWSNTSGFPLSYQDQLAYNRTIAGWVHDLGLSVGLKNNLAQAQDLVGNFDWAVAEDCFQLGTCVRIVNSGNGADGQTKAALQLFVGANKAVWVHEYSSYSAAEWDAVCKEANKQHFNTSRFKRGLPPTGGRLPCNAEGSWR